MEDGRAQFGAEGVRGLEGVIEQGDCLSAAIRHAGGNCAPQELDAQPGPHKELLEPVVQDLAEPVPLSLFREREFVRQGLELGGLLPQLGDGGG